MVSPGNNYELTPVDPRELTPDWQGLEIFPGRTLYEEQAGYLDQYEIGRKAIVSLFVPEVVDEQNRIIEHQVEKARLQAHNGELQRQLAAANRLARTDALTGLPNRLAFMERLEQYVDNEPGNHSLLFIDLTKFKEVNDTLGHQGGDRVLKEVAVMLSDAEILQIMHEVLSETLRTNGSSDTEEARAQDTWTNITARLSGDEFAVVLGGVNDEELAEKIGSRVRKSLQARGIKASLGVAVHSPDENAAQFLHRADQKMFEVKREEDELDKDYRLEAMMNNAPDKYELYNDAATKIWEFSGASEQEFHDLFGSGGR